MLACKSVAHQLWAVTKTIKASTKSYRDKTCYRPMMFTTEYLKCLATDKKLVVNYLKLKNADFIRFHLICTLHFDFKSVPHYIHTRECVIDE